MKFRSDEDGYITALRFYKQPNNTGTHVGHLWSGTGQLLAAATFTGETASGWQEVDLPNPVPITKDTTYVTSYYATAGRFGFSPGYFNQGVDRAPLHAPAPRPPAATASTTTAPAPSRTRPSTRPTTGSTRAFDRTIPPDTRGPTVTEQAPRPAPPTSPATIAVTATFDEPLAPASVTGTTVTLRDEDGNLVAGRRELRRADARR